MKIGFLSLPLTGHLNPMTALARELQSRGHEVVFIGVPDIGSSLFSVGNLLGEFGAYSAALRLLKGETK